MYTRVCICMCKYIYIILLRIMRAFFSRGECVCVSARVGARPSVCIRRAQVRACVCVSKYT